MSDSVFAPELSGLEQLRAAFFGKEEFTGIGGTLGMRPVLVEEGRMVFEGVPDKRVYNPIGTVSGGYAATMLDSAMACAVNSRLAAGQACTTLEFKIAFHRPMTTQSGPVRAEGVVVSLGRRAAFAEGKLTDKDGKLCASATSTLIVYPR